MDLYRLISKWQSSERRYSFFEKIERVFHTGVITQIFNKNSGVIKDLSMLTVYYANFYMNFIRVFMGGSTAVPISIDVALLRIAQLVLFCCSTLVLRRLIGCLREIYTIS